MRSIFLRGKEVKVDALRLRDWKRLEKDYNIRMTSLGDLSAEVQGQLLDFALRRSGVEDLEADDLTMSEMNRVLAALLSDGEQEQGAGVDARRPTSPSSTYSPGPMAGDQES